MISKCKGCERRHVGCHSDCPDYAEYKAWVDKVNEEKYKDIEFHDQCWSDYFRHRKGKQKWK